MTALNIPLKAETYSELLDHYIKTKQFTPAFEVLERMPPSQVAFSRFLNACSERHEMERAETAWKLMKAKGARTAHPVPRADGR
jgi:pentatricopeptide repeat protein